MNEIIRLINKAKKHFGGFISIEYHDYTENVFTDMTGNLDDFEIDYEHNIFQLKDARIWYNNKMKKVYQHKNIMDDCIIYSYGMALDDDPYYPRIMEITLIAATKVYSVKNFITVLSRKLIKKFNYVKGKMRGRNMDILTSFVK